MFVVLSARALNPDLFILGRANLEGSEAKIVQAGANRAVSPYEMAGRRIAELATRPRVAEFLDAALSHAEQRFAIDEIVVRATGRWTARPWGRCASAASSPSRSSPRTHWSPIHRTIDGCARAKASSSQALPGRSADLER